MSLKRQRLGQIGVNFVEGIILREWRSRWQPLDAHNDDGIDGLIFVEQNGAPTGQIVFAQIKCWTHPRIDSTGSYCLAMGSKKLSLNYERWRRVVGAAIVIYVDPKEMRAFWVDARSARRTPSQIFVPKDQPFDRNAKKDIAHLCGTIHRDLLVKTVRTEAEDFAHLRTRDHIQVAAHALYRELGSNPVRLGGDGPLVNFDGKGWEHITRRGRPELTRYQSFVLLGVVRKLLSATTEEELKAHTSRLDLTTPYASARAAVSFPFRQTAIVKLILRWVPTREGRNYYFHTIYEPRRKRNVYGVREPLSR